MSFMITNPDMMAAAASELQTIGSALTATNTAAAVPTTSVLPPAADSVSARSAALLDAAAQQYQAFSAQAETFQNQFVQTLNAAQTFYAETEASNTAAMQMSGASPASPNSPTDIALIMGGTGNPTPTATYVQEVYQTFVLPKYPGYTAQGLYTPEQLWPLTGLNSETFGQSVQQGVAILNNAIMTDTAAGNHVLVVGYSQSATIATMEMRYLDALPAILQPNPNLLNFMLLADPNNPVTGGILTRLIPGALTAFHVVTPADTIYTTAIYGIQYDPVSYFPASIFNIGADLNALFGLPLHTETPLLTAGQLATAIPEQIGNTTYFIVPTLNLPLLDPLRMIPILGNPLANLLQPFLTPFVDFGYATGLPGPLQSIGSLAIAGAGPSIAPAIAGPLAAGLPPVGLPVLSNAM
jgi:PE-PPE domain/PE family